MVCAKSGQRVVRTLRNSEQLQYSYRKFTEGDEQALSDLLKGTLPSLSKRDLWAWKYKSNPNFDPSLIVVAEKDEKIVGCNHWLVRDLKLSNSLKVKAALGADIVVHPEHRRHGVATQLLLFLRQSRAFKDKGIVLSYMFAPPVLSKHLYRPVAGYVAPSNSTTTYKKFFNCRELKERFQLINELIKCKKELQTELKGLGMCLLFKLRGAPVFTIHIEPEGVYLEEGEAENPDVVVEGSLPFSSSIMESNGVWGWTKALITRKLKIRKGLLKASKILKAFKVFKQAFSQE